MVIRTRFPGGPTHVGYDRRVMGSAAPSGSAAFSPSDISGLNWWPRADAGLTTALDRISGWIEQSTNAFAGAQATGSKQPLYVANEVNGNPVTRWDGGDSVVFTGAQVIQRDTPFTAFFVFKFAGFANGFPELLFMKTATNPIKFLLSNNGSYADVCFGAGNPLNFAGLKFAQVLDTTSWHILTVTYDGGTATDAGSFAAYYDGTSKTLTGTGAFGTGTDETTIGGEAAGSNWNGDQGEQIIYTALLSAGELAQMHTYLKAKYNIP